MPSDLPRTIVLDVSKFPAAVSRVEISSAIVHRFTAYKVNAVQFVGNVARVTFSSGSDRDAVMRFESVPASPPVIDPSMARTARRSDRLQQSYIPRRLTRASAKSKTE